MPILPTEVSHYNPVIEGMSREEFARFQWKRLKELLEHVYHTNPYYRRVFQAAKITPDDIKTREDFAARVPLATKKEMMLDQLESPPDGSRLGVPREKVFRYWITSGASGQGQEVYGITRLDSERSLVVARYLYWGGLRRGEVCANFFPTSAGNLAGPDAWARMIERMGSNMLHLGATFTLEQKLERMQRFSPHLVLVMGAYLARMRAGCQEMGIDPRKDFPRLKSVLIGVTPWSVEWIRDMEEFWGAKLFDLYALTQARGTSAANCERGAVYDGKRQVLHLTEDLTYFEVLDRETRQPVAPGEEGELVITPLAVEGSPLLRFATNDKVKYFPYSECPCGRPFDGIEAGNISRFDDMLKIRGLNVWPQAVDETLFAHNEVAEYLGRIWVDSRGQEQVTVSIEFKGFVESERKQALMPQLATEIKGKAGVNMSVEEAREPIAKWQWKAVRWTDERQKGLKRVGF